MDPKTQADILWRQAYELVNKRFDMDQADYHRVAIAKANEIRDFLAVHGVDLEQTKEGYDLVTGLGQAYDAVAAGAAETVHAVIPNPIWSGIKAGAVDLGQRTAAAAQAVGETAATVGKKLHWIALGLGAVAVVGAMFFFAPRRKKA